MKYEATTLNTKKTLAASLKRFMEQKPLSKITITEIITDCGVNRKTFYYHFEDIYDLLKWMLEEEAFEVVKKFDLLVDYKEAILFVLDYVNTNKHLLCCAYDSMGREMMKRFFYRDFIGITRDVVQKTKQEYNIHVDKEYEDFVVHFYTEAIAGILIDSFMENEEHDPNTAVEYLSRILKSSLPSTLASGEKMEG
jgi:probable dihydroxyacetone kinase regulator